MSSSPNISSSPNFPLCIQCWSVMTFIISSSSVSICIIGSFLLFCTFLLFSFPFCIQSLYSCTFACLYFNYFESYPFMHLVLTVWLSMYHIGHINQRNAGLNKSAGPNQEIIPNNSLRDRRWNKKLFALSSAYIRTQQETNILGNPPSPIQIVHTHPARNLTPSSP